MPLYEFECESCHRRFERIQKFSDPSPDVCPHCGKGPVRKLLSTPAIQFKGSGFYITDYGKDGKKGESSAKGTSSSSSEQPKGESASKETTTPASDSTTTSKSDSPKPSSGEKKG